MQGEDKTKKDMKQIEFKDVAGLYIGQMAICPEEPFNIETPMMIRTATKESIGLTIGQERAIVSSEFVRPFLRKLESMTDAEAIEGGWHHGVMHFNEYMQVNRGAIFPSDLVFLASKGFWLFGDEAFEQGFIIEKK